MSDDLLHLKPNVRVQGLVDQFTAWLHTLAPVPAAMNLNHLQLPMLDSYIQQPGVHAAAVANPRMKGGFFVDVAPGRVDEVRDLRDRILREERPLIELAEAVKQAESVLRAQASGYDLTPLYDQLPQALRGLVELVYDVNHAAGLRFLEPVLYRSEYHRPSRQSVDLSLDDGTEPPFILSTPRLPAPGHLQLPIPLAHPGIDTLFALRGKPLAFAEIREALEIGDDASARELRSLLTEEPAPPPGAITDGGGRVRYFGHACLVLQNATTAIVVDPLISSHHAAGDRYTYTDLPEHLDYCLITHGHQDHVVLESLLQIRHRVGVVVVPRNGGGHRQDPSMRLCLAGAGFTVREVDDYDEIPFDGGSIVATPFLGEHCDLDIRGKSTYWIRLAGKTIFVGADSSGLDSSYYRRIREHVGPADIAFIGMECDGAPLTWLYSHLYTQPVPRKMAITRKLSGSDAAQALGIVRELGATEAYVYAMGQEEWLQHIMATSYTPESYQLQQVAVFLQGCRERGIPAEHLLRRKELRW
ncbi:MBL fold metallo-hydrolase [Sphaerisporangium aureirubrum]|uniref:MBL fold metallo-hydrolase n=1 Tax=Sphaerisporangium aureirubrum TaxID=1544736 RepID=A0ABW1NAU2_9ACTN